MIYKGPLKRRGGCQSDSRELLAFLLDHALLMVKEKNKADQFKVHRLVCAKSRSTPQKSLTTLLLIANSAGTAARHRSRRNRHASRRLLPSATSPTQTGPPRPTVPADSPSQNRR